MSLLIDEILESFFGEYKKGLFGKKISVSLYIFNTYIAGKGINCYEGVLGSQLIDFKVDFCNVESAAVENIEGNTCVRIEYQNTGAIVKSASNIVVLPNIKEAKEAAQMILTMKDKADRSRNEKMLMEKKKQEEQMAADQLAQEERRCYFHECYQFHIESEKTPCFELHRDELQFAGIYLDKDRNLNFLRIDGYRKEENNAMIPLKNIHYYEKAGSIQYVSEVNGAGQTFGGSITGPAFSKAAAFWGGLLLGPMGMAAGVLFTHSSAQIKMPSNSMEISSETRKIDDRNVILNYYSDPHQQYVDIELPADIYNFLQTYIPEKKYGIVAELEKQSALKQHLKEVETGEYLSIPDGNNKPLIEDTTDDFTRRIQKLKIMYDNGLLSEEEFANEKRKILSEL